MGDKGSVVVADCGRGVEKGGFQILLDACFIGGANPYIGCERWLKKAAEQNYIYAEELLADKYYEGVYIVKDVKAAIYWYEKAANQGSVYAMYRAGYIYYSEPIDYNKAGQWFSLAAEKGDKDAEEVLRNNLRYNRFTKKWDAVR
ncbi:MAG: tetratricopeptide repeat protein [Faecalibacterium sp.]